MVIKLFVQDQNEYGNPAAAREVATFTTRAAAVAAAQARVEVCLDEFFVAGISAAELWQQWSLFGEDVFLRPDDGAPPFSAMDYARVRSHAMVQRS